MILSRLTSLFLIVCISCNFSTAEDWTQYRGPLGSGHSSESIASVASPKVLWKTPTLFGFSSLSIADGRAFTIVARPHHGEKTEFCVALDADSGDEIWAVPMKPSDYNHDGGNAGARENRGGDGPRSTPSTDGERVFVYDSHMVLRCLRAADGGILWERDIVDEFGGKNIKWFNASSPVLDGERIYVGGGGPGQTFLAFDKTNGDVVWKSGDETITHATPCVTTIEKTKQVIYFVTSGLVSVNASTGNELWRRKFDFAVSTAASPIPAGNLVYCSAGYGVGAGLFRVDQNNVERVWRKPNKLMNHWSTPIVLDGHLYGIFEFKKYGRAPLQCVELKTGDIKWAERGFGPGNCILVGDKLVVLSDAGELVIVRATTRAYEELFRQKVLTGKCWSTPAYSNGRVYIRSTEEAACVEFESGSN